MLAVITGSGGLPLAQSGEPLAVPALRFGMPSGQPLRAQIEDCPVLIMPRHGVPHRVAPHLINYRANIEALQRLGATRVVALNTVGGIAPEAWTGRLVVPHDLIDYTWGREHTFVGEEPLLHADFAAPFAPDLRRGLIDAGRRTGIDLCDGGVYGCTQGPRFETAAEIGRMARDGCAVVGMTGMPEAALARERGLPYAMVSLVVNPAAGRADDPFDLQAIGRVIETGMADVERLLRGLVALG